MASSGISQVKSSSPVKMVERQLAGTSESCIIWFVPNFAGICMAALYYILLGCSVYALSVLSGAGYILDRHSYCIAALIVLSAICHLKVMFTDPGAIPADAHALPVSHSLSPDNRKLHKKAGSRNFCRYCDCYKAPKSHHGKSSFDIILTHQICGVVVLVVISAATPFAAICDFLAIFCCTAVTCKL